MKTGSCQCKAVTYEIASDPCDCNYCCCSICRRLTGSAMGAYGVVKKNEFTWKKSDELKCYQQNENLQRYFCASCGSFILSIHSLDKVHHYLSLGSLDSHDNIEIKYQQFSKSKVPWFHSDEEIDSYDESPDWLRERAT